MLFIKVDYLLVNSTVNRAVHLGADRLGCAPPAMRARLNRRAVLLCALYCSREFLFERNNPCLISNPAPDFGRLHDDEFNFIGALKNPLRRFGSHGGGSVEQQLVVILCVDQNTIAELPIKHNSAATDTPKKISAAKDARQIISETDPSLHHILHGLVGVNDIEGRESGNNFLIEQLLRENLIFVLRADGLLGRLVELQQLGDHIVQKRTTVGVFARRLGRHLLHQFDTAWAVDDALGGGAADDIGMLHCTLRLLI